MRILLSKKEKKKLHRSQDEKTNIEKFPEDIYLYANRIKTWNRVSSKNSSIHSFSQRIKMFLEIDFVAFETQSKFADFRLRPGFRSRGAGIGLDPLEIPFRTESIVIERHTANGEDVGVAC